MSPDTITKLVRPYMLVGPITGVMLVFFIVPSICALIGKPYSAPQLPTQLWDLIQYLGLAYFGGRSWEKSTAIKTTKNTGADQ